MTQLSLLPYILPREWTNDGKLAGGAKIYTYQSGTNTPKTTYKTADGSVLNTNPIIADASGYFVCFLGQGAYRIKVTDQNDVQIQAPLDGIIGGGSGAGGVNSESTSNTTLLLTYSELRSLTTTPDLVYVAGRTTEGDGGQGWFQYIPTSTEIDDDSIILTAQSGSKVYRRIFDGVIDPRWAGLTYSVSIDQATYFNKNSLLSVKYGLPVLYTASTYINQNVSAIDNSTVQMGDGGYFISTIGINMVFNPGSVFIGSDRAFGQSVQPKFSNNVVPEIKLSWMAGNTDDERVTKWINSSIASTNLLLNENATVGSSFNFTSPIQPVPNCYITFTSATPSLSLTVSKIVPTDYPFKIFDIKTSTITALTFTDKALPEWFGAKGDGVNDTVALRQSFLTGNIYLSNAKSYVATSALSLNGPGQTLNISGPGTINIGPTALTGAYLGIEDSTVIANIGVSNENVVRKVSTNSYVGTFTFTTANSAWPNSPSVGSKFVVSGSAIVLTCTSATTPDKLVTDLYAINQFINSDMTCVYDANPVNWASVGIFVSNNATHPSNVSATNKSINGTYLNNINSIGAYENTILRSPMLYNTRNATSLATDYNGKMFDIGAPRYFVKDIDYTVTLENGAWTSVSTGNLYIIPLTSRTAILRWRMISTQGNTPPAPSTTLFAGVTFTPISNALKYWLDGGTDCTNSVVDRLNRYDENGNKNAVVPTCVVRSSQYTFQFGSSKGSRALMSWGDIFPADGSATAQVYHNIGFSCMINMKDPTVAEWIITN